MTMGPNAGGAEDATFSLLRDALTEEEGGWQGTRLGPGLHDIRDPILARPSLLQCQQRLKSNMIIPPRCAP